MVVRIYKYLFAFALISILSPVNSQIIRGPTGNEFFLRTEWYFDGQFTHAGLFYSDDHGQTIEVNYEYGSFPDSPPSLGEVLDDAQPGVLYNKPYYYSDFMISYDFGTSWDSIGINPSIGSYCAGKVAGEIFHSGFSNEGYLVISFDYGQSFDTINTNVKYSFDVGVNPEILYGITCNYGNPNQYFLHISHDNGLTFDECFALDTTITGRSLKDIYRGANSSELYLVSYWIPDHYKIYFSTDDGHTWQFRYRTIDINFWSFSFTPGRASGIFYIARMNMDPTETHTWLYIDYSSDTARTFTTYFHDLTIDVGIPQKGGQSDVENIFCYPNPVSKILFIRNLERFSSIQADCIIEVFDILGEKWDEVRVLAGDKNIKLNISSFPPGLYVAVLKNNTQVLSSDKFLVVR
jgi:hypothetical protein